jgi:hypothetical protein
VFDATGKVGIEAWRHGHLRSVRVLACGIPA